jgi:hypothetical protein
MDAEPLQTEPVASETYSNSLTGTLPTEFGLMTSLNSLVWSDNKIEGTIPTQLARLTKLTKLSVHSNLSHPWR